MKVKEYYEKTKSLLKNNDYIHIFAMEELPNGEIINHYIELPYDLKRYPLLNDLEIIREREYIVNYTDATIYGKSIKTGKAKQYSAIVDYGEMRKAKGLKPINYTKTKGRFTL